MAENADEDSTANFDLICALCDNGGEIASCEGKCLRSFHATKDAGEDCQTLGYTRVQFDAMEVFLCKNCEYERYQCFACRRLGSAKTDSPEVFPCASASCGHFYHAKCVAQLFFPENGAKATEYTAKIANGAKFACPIHRCDVCKYGENKEVKELQFAVCRRCPKSYHRRCLPRKIAFDDFIENGVCLLQRAWDGLLPNNHILIYCLKHDVDPKLRTPLRDHIKFPDDPAVTKKPFNVNEMNKRRVMIRRLEEREHPIVPLSGVKRPFGTMNRSSLSNFETKRRKVPLCGGTKPCPRRPVSGEKTVVMSTIPFSSFPEIDINTERRIHKFAQEVSSDITIEDVQKKLVVSSTYTPVWKNNDRITLGKVERSVEAIKTALHMLEDGANIEDAKAVCAPSDLFLLAKWKNKLNIYLAPFLHGMRYTSYGRHFTKLDKLEQIVDKLQWYIQSGDTVLDFCCGSNDFSLLLKEKLEASEKNCFYKNYDLIQPKNDFNFERRDWMTVQPYELPTGCRLIMGLNPPFGFKASLANQFINKALTFKPKLIILIVPKETERLDKKYPPYELIWEDSNQLSGKSFYLPGSLDADNKLMEQWNLSPPLLSLWSRSDWARRHTEIAKTMGHVSSKNLCYGDSQREIADVASMGNDGDADIHDEEKQGEKPAKASVLEQLLADTYLDTTSSPGDYWIDTNGRSRQPCNYDTPGRNDPTHEYHVDMGASGRNDPTHEYHADMGAGSDMSISSSDRSDFQKQIQTVSFSELGRTGPQACNLIRSVPAEQAAGYADCEDVTSAGVQYCRPGASGRNDPSHPTHEYHADMGAGSDMSISSSDRSDCQKQIQTLSISEHGRTGPQACNLVESVPAEQATGYADCEEVTSAGVKYCGPEDSPPTQRPATDSQCGKLEDSPTASKHHSPPMEELGAGFLGQLNNASPAGKHADDVQYQRLEDSPSPACEQLEDSRPPADVSHGHSISAENPPPRNTFPGLRFAPAALWHGCYASREVLSRGMDQPTFRQGASSGWIEE